MNYRNEFLKKYQDLYNEYSSIDHTQAVSAEKRAFWIEGDPAVRKALFLAHGYMGSPSEMLHLAKPFLQRGWSIIGFLIPGHGSTSQVANAYRYDRWQKEMAEQLNLVSFAFDEFHAIGFSTGGLLLHDFLRNHSAPKNFRSLHLVSPFYQQRFATFCDGLIEKILNHKSVPLVYALTRFRDLKVMVKNPLLYNRCIPVTTAREIKKLGAQVLTGTPIAIDVPVQLFLTKGDWTVKQSASKKVVMRDYLNFHYIYYDKSDPHHLMSPVVSPRADDVQQKISQFVFRER